MLKKGERNHTGVVKNKRLRRGPSSHHPRLFPHSKTPAKVTKNVRFQHSLLILIQRHLLDLLLTSSLEVSYDDPRRPLFNFKDGLYTFIERHGYVSRQFLQAAFLAVRMFFQGNTFPIVPEDLPQLCSYASLFEAEVRSVFFHVYKISKVEEILDHAPIVSGFSLYFENTEEIEFLNNLSCFFPFVKRLHVAVHPSISMTLIELLRVNNSVTHINLRYNSIGDEGAIALAETLKVNTGLTSLVLSRNFIGDEGVKALADALKVNKVLKSLDLFNNLVSAEGARALAEALKVNVVLTHINLSHNTFGTEGARALAEALKVNATLTSIQMGGKSINEDAARILADAIQVNTTLSTLDLKYSSIGEGGARALADAVKINRNVKIER
ncbi:hypothetical protein GEMRC1_000115 [Eukaryota sp. GEM-RC1]